VLAQDEPGEFDDVIETEGFKFVIDKDLVKLADPITIDVNTYTGSPKVVSRVNPGKSSCSR
jgi:hypothetical protein